ncbi:hypothetical protein [Chryseobacterium artocarpi]|uniref:hypothetical protein n=1 Tax=Chryseobacterium artocarpi TaxID=1414727 RepID=UPI003F4013AE
MLIEFKTSRDYSRFININKIVMVEPGSREGTFIYLNDVEKLYTPEDCNEVQKRINEAFEKSKK